MSESKNTLMSSGWDEFLSLPANVSLPLLFTQNTSDSTNRLSNLENFPTGISEVLPVTASILPTSNPSPFAVATETPAFDWNTPISATLSKIETELPSAPLSDVPSSPTPLPFSDLKPCFRCGESKILTFHDFGSSKALFPVPRGKGMTCPECIYAACSVGHCIHPSHRRSVTPFSYPAKIVKAQMISTLKLEIEELTKDLESLSSQD